MIRIATLLLSVSLLQGCAGLLVAGGVGAAASAHDRRSLGTQIDDKTTSSRINSAIAQNKALDEASHIVVNVFNGIALLVGQTPSETYRQQAGELAAGVPNIRKVHNLLRISAPTAAGTRANDIWIQSKVKAQLIADERVGGLHIHVIVEDSEVFLMGLVNENEAAVAVDIARNVSGVTQVVKAFEYR